MPLVAYTPPNARQEVNEHPGKRVSNFYLLIAAAGVLFIGKLFYLQIIRADHYRNQAISEHQKKFVIPAKRGVIYAQDGGQKVPLVLNETKKLIFADPRYISDKDKTAKEVASAIGGDEKYYKEQLEHEGAYVILAKNVEVAKADALKAKNLIGVGQTDTPVRVYPQGQTASQVLGFVNGDGEGQYGLEEFLNDELQGKDGLLKAVTDVNGVPLAASENSVEDVPTQGKDVTLTIDINLQRYLEERVKLATEQAKAPSASAVIIESQTGAVKAMANFPTYDARSFTDVTDYNLFSNRAVSAPFEAGSVMKVLTVGAALSEGVVNRQSTYADPGQLTVDTHTIKNAINHGAGTRSVYEILKKSLNTGVVSLLKMMGGGEINEKARTTLHNYFADKYRLNKTTGIEQAGEVAGNIEDVTTGAGDNIRYANMTFGQGMSVTTLEIAAAMAAIANGGTYYQPTLLTDKTKQVLEANVLKPEAASDLLGMMKQYADESSYKRPGYFMGGKTGTAQLLEANGLYSDTRTTGTYLGFIGSSSPEYIIMIRIDDPNIAGFSGSTAAAPVFSDIAGHLINYYGIPAGS